MAAVLLAACGGGDSSGDDGAAGPGIVEMKTVTATAGDDGCVTHSNADQSVDYLMGDKPARHLTWFCADYGESGEQQVTMLLTFDFDRQCFRESTVHAQDGMCGQSPPPAPRTPMFGVLLDSFTVRSARDEQGLPGLRYQAALRNTGNVPAHGVQFQVNIDGTTGGKQGIVNGLAPGQTRVLGPFASHGEELQGRSFDLEIFVRDAYGAETGYDRAQVVVR